MATVTLDGVRKSFGPREAVHGVTCAVTDGELVVVGPSGCGKSTLLQMVAGHLRPGGVAIGDLVIALALEDQPGKPGRAVTVGLRPEHLELANDGPIPLKTELLERLGADTIVHGRLAGGTALIARAGGTLALRLGEPVRLAVVPEHIHLFDAESGRRL